MVAPVAPPVNRSPLALAAALALAACETQPTHEVLAVTDLAPRQLEAGDRVVVRGSGFPQAADIRRVSVTLTGTLARPGLAPCARPVSVTLTDPPEGERVWDPAAGVEREAAYATATLHTLRVHGGTDIEFTLTEELVRALTLCPGERDVRAPHATVAFAGQRTGVSVRVETMQGATLASARPLRGPRVDVLAPWGREVAEGRAARAEADRALAALGIRLAESQPPEGGLQVERVAPGSAADEAGLGDGDVMERLDGVSLLGVTDFRPAAGGDLAVVSVRRGDAVEDRALRVASITRAASQDVAATAVLLLVALAVVGFGMSPTRGLLGWLAARFLPPRAVRAPVTSRREAVARAWADVRAAVRDDAGFWSAAVGSTALAVPFAEFLFAADVDLGAVHLVGALASLAVAAVVARDAAGRATLAGSLLGAARRAAFELAAAGATVVVVLLSGSIDAQGVAAAQGGAPWDWYLFRGPALLALGAAHLAALVPLAADARAASARGLRGVAWATLLARSACAAVILCGGARLPGLSLAEQGASVALQMLGAVALLAKTWGLAALARRVAPAAAAAHPALRTALALRHLVPLAVVGAVLTVAGDALAREAPAAARELAVAVASLATFGAVVAALALAARRPPLPA